MTEKCLWKSPHKSVGSFSIVESSVKFEKKYGIQVFSDAVEKSEEMLVPVKPSDLEFSPEVRKFIGVTDSTFVSQAAVSGSKTDTITAEIVAASKSAETPVKESTPTLDKSATSSVQRAALDDNKAYLQYKGVSFGQTQSPPQKSSASLKLDPSLSFNPWFLSDGLPNFARNTVALPSGTGTLAAGPTTTCSSSSSTGKRSREDEVDNQSIQDSVGPRRTSNVAAVETAAVAPVGADGVTTIIRPVEVSTVSQPVVAADELSEEESLLKEIKEEIRRTKAMDQKIVDAIVGTRH